MLRPSSAGVIGDDAQTGTDEKPEGFAVGALGDDAVFLEGVDDDQVEDRAAAMMLPAGHIWPDCPPHV